MIKLICVGKLKENYWSLAEKEYLKRLQKYIKLEVIEVQDEKTDDVIVVLKKEKERIEKYLDEKDYVVTLEIIGDEKDTYSFTSWLENTTMNYSNITFIIGGSCGLHEDIKKRSNKALSFSKLTFPHQLFRIMFLEQLYRSYKIRNHESYHK